jgi:hypothetical protein
MNDATGIALYSLLCPNEHCIGRLIKSAAHQPVRISLPGIANQQWPRAGDEGRTVIYCQQCEQQCGEGTGLLESAMTELVGNDSEHEAVYILGWERE